MKTIYLKEFSLYPGPRFERLGPDSGERFRREVLIPAVSEDEDLTVVLDGVVSAPGSSFLEEAFGGLIREGVDPSVVKSIKILSELDPPLKEEVYGYISEAIECRNA